MYWKLLGVLFPAPRELSVFWCRKLLTLSKIEGDGSSVPVPLLLCFSLGSIWSTISSLYCTFQRSNARIHLPSKMASLKWQTSRTVTSTVQKLPITAIQDLFSGVRIQMQFFEYLSSIPVQGKYLRSWLIIEFNFFAQNQSKTCWNTLYKLTSHCTFLWDNRKSSKSPD